jgi:hypothetical protein
MNTLRQPARDPRTVARDIPGILDALFPQLAPGVVMHFNRGAESVAGCEDVPHELVTESSLQNAMLFEIAVAASEQLVDGSQTVSLDDALNAAIRRQRRHFDAKLPNEITEKDKEIVLLVSSNILKMLEWIKSGMGAVSIERSPHIPGFMWISSGSGDFSINTSLVEIKCTNKVFSSSDYRQVLMYWLLSFASSVEGGEKEWDTAFLVNPRLNKIVRISFNDVIQTIGAGRSVSSP